MGVLAMLGQAPDVLVEAWNWWPALWQTLFSIVGAVGALQFWGKKWIENRFAQRLEASKHEHAQELARLRVEVDGALDGILKLQTKEFEILPEAWRQLDQVHRTVGRIVSLLQELPRLDKMNDDDLEEFLDRVDLADGEKSRIRKATGRQRIEVYRDIQFQHSFNRTRQLVEELRDYIAGSGIFLPPDLASDFDRFIDTMWSALAAQQTGEMARAEGSKEVLTFMMQANDLHKKAGAIHADIRTKIQTMLWKSRSLAERYGKRA